jgi:hypothetical protein
MYLHKHKFYYRLKSPVEVRQHTGRFDSLDEFYLLLPMES